MPKTSNPVGVVIDAATAFIERHPDLSDTQKAWGGLAWGLLRAIAECPNCPNHFRVPTDAEWSRLICPNCRGVWEKKA